MVNLDFIRSMVFQNIIKFKMRGNTFPQMGFWFIEGPLWNAPLLASQNLPLNYNDYATHQVWVGS